MSSPNTWGAYSIDWGDGSALSTGSSWSPPTFQNHLYTATVDTFVVTITEIATGCVVTGVVVMEEATSASIQIPVGGLTQACAPQMMEFINSATNVSETTTFTWNFGDGSPILTFDHTNWLQTIQHTYEVGTVTCETVVTLTAENYCNTVQGGHSTATFNPIRIWDLDDPAITASATLLCYPDTTVTFTNTTYRNCLFQGNIYQRYEWWNFGDYWNLGHDSIIDWTPWPPTQPRTMHYPGIGTYTVQLLDSNFCGIAPTSITIQIVPPPTAGIAASADTVCLGEPITFYQQSTGGANSWRWNLDNGSGWFNTGSGNITYVYNTPGTYNVATAVSIVGATAGCTDTAWVQVVVLPAPSVDIQPVTAGCDSLTVDYIQATTNAISWEWTFDVPPYNHTGQNPPSIFYDDPGSYVTQLTATSLNGCSRTDTEVIQVYQSPDVDFIVQNLCEGDSAYFSDISTTSANDSIVFWSWDFGDGGMSNEQHPSYLYDNTGTFTVTLNVNSAHCPGSGSSDVTVEARPEADATSSVDTGCSPLTVSFGNSSTDAVDYQWILSDGSVSTDFEIEHTFNNTTNQDTVYSIILKATNAFGCYDFDTLYVTVHPGAHAAFSHNGNPPGCSPFTGIFVNSSINASSYQWDFGDGGTATTTNASHPYLNNTGLLQTYNVTLYAYNVNGCHDTLSQNIVVYPIADFDFSITGASGCAPLTVNMPYVAGVQSFNWDFGDGLTSTSAIPAHTYTNLSGEPEDYTVRLIGISAFGCRDTAYTTVTTFPMPVAQFGTNTISGCAPLEVEFNNISIRADEYEWTYGDGNSSNVPDSLHTHIFENTGNVAITRQITLNATTEEGCASQFNATVQIYPAVSADFGDPGVFCSPVNISFVNTSINANNYQWDFGNGLQSVMPNPTTYYSNNTGEPMNLDVQLVALSSFGCTDTIVKPVLINPTPVAEFVPNILAGCSPLTVDFLNTSINADSNAWDYGDGNTSTVSDTLHSHTFQNSTSSVVEYNVVLVTSSEEGCSSQHSVTIQVYPELIAAFAEPGEHCSPANISFINNSVNANGYNWDFGNGVQSVMQNPTGYFANASDTAQTLQVQLFVSSPFGCNASITHDLIVHPVPVVDFSMNENAACFPAPVELTNNSTNATSYHWNYGDGTSSDTLDTVHVHLFQQPIGSLTEYNIVLTGTTDFGCTASASGIFDLYPQVQAAFASDTIGCSPFNAVFNNQSIDAAQYQWTFGDGQVSTIPNPSHQYAATFTNDTTYTAQLIAMNIYGCTDTATKVIHVMHTPVAVAQMQNIAGCYPTVATLYNGSIGADYYQWVYGTGQTSDIADTVHQHAYYNYTQSLVTYPIILHAYTNYGCHSSDNLSIQVAPEIEASFLSISEGCSPLSVFFDNTSQGGISSQWNFGDGDFSDEFEPQHTFFNWGMSDTTYTITLVLADSYGCTDTVSTTVSVFPIPVAGFGVSPVVQTWPNATVELENLTIGGNLITTWSMGDGTLLDEMHPGSYTYSSWGEYDIELDVTNGSCSDEATQTIQILPPQPIASFTGPASGCAPLEVHFENHSEYALSSYWTFGDGGSANATNPVYTYWQPGTYTVTLTIEGPGGITDQMVQEYIIEVYPNAHAVFTVTPTEVNVPVEPVYCINMSVNANSYHWTFGDGSTSNAEDPVYYYQEEGVYSIELIANNQFNCPDTMLLTDIVKATASGMIDFPNAFSPTASSSQTGYYDPRSFDNDIFFPTHKGVETYQLLIFNKWGELLYESNDVNKGWNGYYRGQLAKQDVYVWKVRATFIDGQVFEKAGDVTLILK